MPDDSDVSGEAGAPRGRDFWVKAKAIAGLTTAVLVALIGGLFTYVYSQRRLSAQPPWHRASPTTGQTAHFDGTSSSCSQQPFCGDFETGDQSQWAIPNLIEGDSSITVATAASQPVTQGAYSAKFVTNPGTGTARAEVNASQAQTGGYPGQEWYYGWWTYFPSVNGEPQQWWPNGGDWNDIVQFPSVDWTAWMYLGVDQGNYTPGTTSIYLEWGGVGHLIAANPIRYDHWYHFVLHVKWSTDPAVGFAELDVDGTTVIPLTYGPSLYNTTVAHNPSYTAPGSYATLDLYHGATSFTNTVIHDGFCRAATYTDAAACGPLAQNVPLPLDATSARRYAQGYARTKWHARSPKVTSRRTASNRFTCRVTWRANGKKRTRTVTVKRTSRFGVIASAV